MESLAILAALIVAIASIGGPLSLFISHLYQKHRKNHLTVRKRVRYVCTASILLLAIPAVLVGLRLVTLDLGLGGKAFGLTGIITGSISLRKLLTLK